MRRDTKPGFVIAFSIALCFGWTDIFLPQVSSSYVITTEMSLEEEGSTYIDVSGEARC